MSKFEVYKGMAGYRWRLKANNGEIVATSQTYTSKESAKHGCIAVRHAADDAEIVDTAG